MAEWFCRDRRETFVKDMEICMTPDSTGSHAYMPGLISCATIIELFSGLWHGEAKDPVPLNKIIEFMKQFFDGEEFTEEAVVMFFTMFRHKVAHVSKPYSVFRTHNVRRNNPLLNYPDRRFSWCVKANHSKPAILLEEKRGMVEDGRKPSWKSGDFEWLCTIHLKRLIKQIQESIFGATGYLYELKRSRERQEKFVGCMDEFYQ